MIEKLYLSFDVVDFYSKEGFLIRSYARIQHGKELVIIFNPICIQIELISPLLNEISRFFSVLTLESRGTYPVVDASIISKNNMSLTNHIMDIKRIIESYKIKEISHIIGFSSGCETAAIISKHLTKYNYKSISFISPSFKFKNVKKYTHQYEAEVMWINVINKNKTYIKLIKDLIVKDEVLEIKNLDSLIKKPFKREDTMLMYCYLNSDFFSVDMDREVRNIKKNMLIIHAKDDTIVPSEVSVHAHKIAHSSKLILKPKGGHFLSYGDFEIIESILSFMWCSS